MAALLRTFRRKVSIELSLDDFVRLELWRNGAPDLDLSTYAVEAPTNDVLRVVAEHVCSFTSPPPKEPTGAIDLAGAGSPYVKPTVGGTKFRFTRDAHRELCFIDAAELESAAKIVHAQLTKRTHVRSRDEVRQYVKARLLKRDAEWQGIAREWHAWALKEAPAANGNAVQRSPTTNSGQRSRETPGRGSER